MPIDFVGGRCGFPVLRFVATLKAARDLGLDPEALDAVALQFDPREPDLDGVADELAAACFDGARWRSRIRSDRACLLGRYLTGEADGGRLR